MKARAGGKHEVHTHNCRYLPITNKKIHLGYFADHKEAMKKAKEFYKHVNACNYCISEYSKKVTE
jgi:hypothetical protein